MQLNNVEDPAAVLAIPEDEDAELILRALEDAYAEIEDAYETAAVDDTAKKAVVREGSLYQELFAQLSDQGFSRYD
jgi:hypothetical protein